MKRAPAPAPRDLPGLRTGWTRPDRRPIYVWAHENEVELHANYARPGRFDVSTSRHLIEPFHAIADPLIREVSYMKAIQSGGTMLIDLSIPYFMCNDPGPMMWTFQSDGDGKQHMKTRAMPLWETIKPLRPLLPTSRFDTTTMEIFADSFFFIANGANPNSLQSASIRYKFNSELWLPTWQDLYKQAVGRVSAFAKEGTSKIVNDSQAGNTGDVMCGAYNRGSREEWSLPCPECGKTYPLRISQKREDGSRFGLLWDDDALRADKSINVARAVETVSYVCHCGHSWPDGPRTWTYWNDHAVFVRTNPDAPVSVRSFWWSGLVATSMADLAQQKAEALNAKRAGFDEELRTFKQQREVEPWEERTLSITLETHTHGYKLADYANGQPVADEVDRVMTIDRGMDHFWCEVVAWRADGSTRHLHAGRYETVDQLREIQLRFKVSDRKTYEDTGHNQDAAFKDCIIFGWIGMRGAGNRSWKHIFRNANNEEVIEARFYSPLQRGQGGAPYFYFSSNDCQDILANLLGSDDTEAGGKAMMEFPDDVIPEVFEHFKGAHKVEKTRGQWVWEKIHSRSADHIRDCRVMQIVFGLIKGYLKHRPAAEEKKVA